MLIEILEGSDRIVCVNSEIRHKDLISAIPGASWSKQTYKWTLPLTWASCQALRGTFGDSLEIGPALYAWATDFNERVYLPALALRDALSAPGDEALYPHQRADVAFLVAAKQALLGAPW